MVNSRAQSAIINPTQGYRKDILELRRKFHKLVLTVDNRTDCSNRSDGASVGELCAFRSVRTVREVFFGVFRPQTRAQRVS